MTAGQTACPLCGNVAQSLSIPVPEISVTVKAKNPGERPHIEVKQGSDYSRSRKKFVRLARVIDRGNDSYSELVTDPHTGEVIHRCQEPLSKHQGRGTARRKKT